MAPRLDVTVEAARPRRGARAYVAWILGMAFFAYAFAHRVAPSVMVAELMRDFDIGAAIVGHLSGLYLYVYAALQFPVGLLIDRFGPRRLLTAAAAVAAAGSLIFAGSSTLAGASVGRLLIGAGVAFSWVGVLVLTAQLFSARSFAAMAGVGQMAGMAGAVFGQAPLGVAVGLLGWRTSLVTLAGIGFALAAGLWLTVRDPRPRAGAAAAPLRHGVVAVLGNPQSWLCAAVGLALTAPMLGFGGLWAVPFLAARHGIDRPGAAALASLMAVGWGVAAPAVGWLSDRLGSRRQPLLCGGALLTLSLLAILYWPGLPPAADAVLLLASGAAGSTMVLAFASGREHNAPEHSGTVYGLVNTAVIAGGALMQPLIGLLLDRGWNGETLAGVRVYDLATYQTALAALPVLTALGMLAALRLRESHPRRAGA